MPWDEAISSHLHTKWLLLKDSFGVLNTQIPKLVIRMNLIRLKLHAIYDSSESADSACAYLNLNDRFSNCALYLLASQSRFVPLKKLPILTKFLRKVFVIRIAQKSPSGMQNPGDSIISRHRDEKYRRL